MAEIPSTPKSLEAEQALLGSLIMDSSGWEKIADKINPNDFFDINNQIIFTEMLELSSNNQPIDILVLGDSLKNKSSKGGQSILDKVGGIDYLGTLAKIVPTSAHINAYADIIREKSIMRNLIEISNQTIQQVHRNENSDIMELLDRVETNIFNVRELKGKKYGWHCRI